VWRSRSIIRIGSAGARGLERALHAGDEHALVAPGRDEAVHRIVQRHQALLDQHHEGHARDRLGHRIDSKQAVGLQRLAPLDIGAAQHRRVGQLAAPPDLGQRAGQFTTVDILGLQKSIDALQSITRQSHGFWRTQNPGLPFRPFAVVLAYRWIEIEDGAFCRNVNFTRSCDID
jgi:hypothetical protein